MMNVIGLCPDIKRRLADFVLGLHNETCREMVSNPALVSSQEILMGFYKELVQVELEVHSVPQPVVPVSLYNRCSMGFGWIERNRA
jgi:hypothetical protein